MEQEWKARSLTEYLEQIPDPRLPAFIVLTNNKLTVIMDLPIKVSVGEIKSALVVDRLQGAIKR